MYKNQGKANEAVGLQEKVLEAERRVLGEEHPSTLTTMNNLASTLKGLGRTTEAIHFMQKSLAGSERLLGGAHPVTMNRKDALDSWIGILYSGKAAGFGVLDSRYILKIKDCKSNRISEMAQR
jgi:hypothetical protein